MRVAITSIHDATAGSPSTFTYTILDDDQGGARTVQFTTATSSLLEDGETRTVALVTLSSPSPQLESLEFNIGGTATGVVGTGQDYATSPNPFLVFQPGETQKEVWFANEFANPNPPPGTPLFIILYDSLQEPNETITLTLALPSPGITINQAQATHTFTIVDDDAPVIQFESAASNPSYVLGSPIAVPLSIFPFAFQNITLSFTVTYTPPGLASEVSVETSPITIPASTQFPVITINPIVSIPLGGDVVITLTSATGATLGSLLSHTVTIVN
jgi:hypothetical protein